MPVGQLMIEHRLVERMISILQRHVEGVDFPGNIDLSIIENGIDFMRTYADRCHHGKEEDYLFRALKGKALSDEHNKILNELLEEHTIARASIRGLDKARERALSGDSSAYPEIQELVQKLAKLYPAHIEKEDKRFFVAIMSYFSQAEQEEMLRQFASFDQGLIHEKYGLIVNGLEDNPHTLRQETSSTGDDMAVYECTVCGYKYDPAVGDPKNGIPAGTPFASLPHDWVCPLCGSEQDLFVPSKNGKSKDNQLQKTSDSIGHGLKEYRSKDLIVLWDPKMCSHAGKCWKELPEVFKPAERPWIDLAAGRAEDIIHTIDKCPTGALQYRLTEDSSLDPALAKGQGSADFKITEPVPAIIRIVNNGPLLVEGPAKVFDHTGNLIKEYNRFAFCRCGMTANQPFCDGSHIHNMSGE